MNSYNEYVANILIGKKLISIGRCMDVIMFGFGIPKIRKNRKGESEFYPEFSLHLQTAFRIAKSNKILIAYNDIFAPSNEEMNDFDYTESGTTLFDKKLLKYNKQLINDLEVLNLEINDMGDIKMVLKSNIYVETFNIDSGFDEIWRFFKVGADEEHLVAHGGILKFE